MTRKLHVGGAALVGLIVGAIATLAAQSAGTPPAPTQLVEPPSTTRTAVPVATTFLAWVPRGLPSGFGDDVAALDAVGSSTVVVGDVVWLEASWNAAGERVDDPPPGFRIPLDAAAIDPASFAAFVPEPERAAIAAVADGHAVLSTTGAALRGLEAGSMLQLRGGFRIRVAAVLPDDLVGAAEVVVSRRVGRRIGIVHDRYVLVRPVDAGATATEVKTALRPLLPEALGVNRRVQVRAPGDTPYFRAGDAVLPMVAVKTLFGEFAAKPRPGAPGELIVDGGWLRENIVKARIPGIGRPTSCHRLVVPLFTDAMRELRRRGAGDAVRTYHGCFVPRYIGRDPANMLSYHSWGIAFDVNLAGNVRGVEPNQPPILVRALERHGFTWGGRWLVPDGSHFEFHRFP
jgi:hypothetical protein